MSVRKLRAKIAEYSRHAAPPMVPDDPVEFCRARLNYEPYKYAWPILRD